MNNTIISRPRQVLIWFFWFFAILAWFGQAAHRQVISSGAECPAVARSDRIRRIAGSQG